MSSFHARSIIGTIMLLLVALSVACEKPGEGKAEDATIDPVPVEAMTVHTQTFVDRLEVSAVVEPIKEVRVAAEAPGRILRAPFEEGEKVERGKLLLRVDSQLDTARLDVLQNQVETARREYERTQMLAKEGLATPQQLDQAESALEGARLNLKQAKVGIGKSTIRSPITGYVATKFVEKGEYAAPGSPLAHIVNYDTVVINASVPEGDVRYVKEGQEVEIWLPGLERRTRGKVERRGIIASSKTRTFPLEIHVDNPNREILPGMRARVIISREVYEDVIVVSRDAILQGFDRQEAMVVPGEAREAKAELRDIEVGPAKGNQVVITSGLDDGDRLIVKGHRGIADGTLVKVVGETEAKQPKPDEVDVGDGQDGQNDPDGQDGQKETHNGAATSPEASDSRLAEHED